MVLERRARRRRRRRVRAGGALSRHPPCNERTGQKGGRLEGPAAAQPHGFRRERAERSLQVVRLPLVLELSRNTDYKSGRARGALARAAT